MADVTDDAIARAIKSVDAALMVAEQGRMGIVTVPTEDLHLVMRWTATLARREYQRSGTLPRG